MVIISYKAAVNKRYVAYNKTPPFLHTIYSWRKDGVNFRPQKSSKGDYLDIFDFTILSASSQSSIARPACLPLFS